MKINLEHLVFNHKINLKDSYSVENNKLTKKNYGGYYFEASIKSSLIDDEDDLLSFGFWPDLFEFTGTNNNEVYWRPMRVTRVISKECSLEENTIINRFKKEGYSYFETSMTEDIIPSLNKVYSKYREIKNFEETIDLSKLLLIKNLLIFGVNDKFGNPCAYNICIKTNKSICTTIVMQSERNKFGIGSVLRSYIREKCKKENIEFFYSGDGYESWGIYKANDSKGFQWWTGTEWSSDKNLYISLCEKD